MDEQEELPVVQAGLDRARELFAKRQGDPATMAKFEESLLDTRKSGWTRLGAFDPAERSHCLDLLGFERQLVLPTFIYHQFAHSTDPNVLRAGSRALNRALGSFCSHDSRLRAIGHIPMSIGPEDAGALVDQGLREGCYSFMIETNQPDPKARSFTHPDYDPVWARLAEARAPFVAHVAVNGEYQAVSPSFNNNGFGSPELDGDAPSGALGTMAIHNSASLFLSSMIFDGVFTRFPKLRGISMEHGATWVPSWLHTLDFAVRSFRRFQPHLNELDGTPSEVARRHLKFSPFAGEPVGWIIDAVGPELLVFGSDYPHPEGTPNPIERFEAAMPNCDQATLDAFYHGNMEELTGERLTPAG